MIFATLLFAAAGGRAEVVVPTPQYTVQGEVQVSGPWYETLADPSLNALVDDALDRNLDLLAADRRVDQARNVTRQSAGALLPSVTFDYSTGLNSCDSLGFNLCMDPMNPTAETSDSYSRGQYGVNGSWGVDIWGRTTSGANAQRLTALATEGDRDALALAVSTRVAEAWFDVGSARLQLAIVQEQVSRSEDLMAIVELRYERSEASALDLLSQQQQVAASRSQLPSAEVALLQAQQRLSALLNDPVDSTYEGGLPEVGPLPTLGTPEDLLVNRPDLRAAEKRVNAALANERATEKTVLPSVGVSAGYNRQFLTLDDETSDVDIWNAGVNVSVPLFAGGSKVSGIGAARANTDAVTLSANQDVVEAIAEVEGAIVRDQQALARRQATQVQLQAATLAWDEARRLYAEGLSSYLELLNALSALQNAQLSELSAHREQLSARVALHAALGWTRG